MIKIFKSSLSKGLTGVRLETTFEIDGAKNILWYEVDEKYEEYLTYERADGAVVGLLWFALKHGHDMHILYPMSERLYYTLNTYLIPIISEIHGYRKIKLVCNELVNTPMHNIGGVGTGLSCGVDSLSTVYEHMKKDIPENYKITHFTFLNVGSNGELGGARSSSLFKERARIAKACADELGKDLILVDSNLSQLIKLGWGPTHTLRSVSAILSMQKLFKVYYFSSAIHLKDFKLTKKDPAYYDVFNLSMLSTEGLSFFSSCTNYTRLEKTRIITKLEQSYKYLNVCLRGPSNCGECEKCLRTLLTLEVLHCLDKYKAIFNLDAYYKKRAEYIDNVVKNHSKSAFLKEIYNEMIATKFKH
jgi:hypothetical protein